MMMKLSTMKKVMDTVDADWRSPLADQIAAPWGYDPGSVLCLRCSANFVFVLRKEGRLYFLRFNDACERELSQVESEIGLLLYLRDQPVRTAQPVPSRSGKYVETVHTEVGTYHAVLFEALPGDQLEIEDLNAAQFRNWGSALGRLHHILKSIPESFRRSRLSSRDRLEIVRGLLPGHEQSAIAELHRIIDWAEQLPVTGDNYGLIHYDFELDNHRWEGQTVGTLDFDDCCAHWYAADIANALGDVSKYEVDVSHPGVKAFIEGYITETPLDPDMIAALNWFKRMDNLLGFADLLRVIDLPDAPEDPEWLSKLRSKLLAAVDGYRSHLDTFED
ncbi:phosphotransferase [Paenibacillus sp. sptzw28]|uniref:phosphotransferase enzyme family protein n=1 Tax=Paenibacillus sp. sptzw28 TaxID=715179 RepID=UPI001C6E276C|nr:phosphotransferase [Paenibacillus sp. sptzw28]QYR21186.1 phosphotransferase [Paenibacillus sp. sptzw28]